MAEHPILFTSEMVKAVLDGRKTQTRRIINPQPIVFDRAGQPDYANLTDPKKKWRICDMLWVREAWWDKGSWETDKEFKRHWVRWPPEEERIDFYYDADGQPENIRGSYTSFGSCVYLRKHPSIHMFRKDARIFLEITNIRVERVRSISETDCIAEGIITGSSAMGHIFTAKEHFKGLWDSINTKRSYGWDKNPFCWVIEFKNI